VFVFVLEQFLSGGWVLEFGYKIERLGMKGGSHESHAEESKIREVYGDKGETLQSMQYSQTSVLYKRTCLKRFSFAKYVSLIKSLFNSESVPKKETMNHTCSCC